MNIIQYDILSFIHQDTRIYFSTKSCLCGVWLKGFFHHWFYFSYHTEFLKKVWTNMAWMLGIINHLVLLWLLHWWSLSMSGYVFSLYNYRLFLRVNCKCYWFQAPSCWKPTKKTEVEWTKSHLIDIINRVECTLMSMAITEQTKVISPWDGHLASTLL